MSKVAFATLVASMLVTPVTAFAYLGPEAVFGDVDPVTETPETYPEQVTKRSAEDVNARQQARAAEARAEAQQSLIPNYAEPEDTYAPEAQPLGLFDENTQYEKRQDRIDSQNTGGPTIIITGDGDIVDSRGNVLHSGAPRITATGPMTLLVMVALAIAAACTVGYVQIWSRKTR